MGNSTKSLKMQPNSQNVFGDAFRAAVKDYLLIMTVVFVLLFSPYKQNILNYFLSGGVQTVHQLNVPYANSIQTVANRERINPLILISIIQIESNFDPYAESYAGAQGLTQMMPYMQKAYDCDPVLGNPAESISCGGHFLGYLVHKYDNLDLAVAAYHAGEPLVDACNCVPRPVDQEYVRRFKAAYAKHAANSKTTFANASKISSRAFVMPYKQHYYVTNSQPHLGGYGAAQNGIDISTAYIGAPVYAPISGIVKAKGIDGLGNTYIFIKNDTCEVAILHGNYTEVQVGDAAVAGVTLIGYEASNGNSSGPHSHLAYACNGIEINPLTLVNK